MSLMDRIHEVHVPDPDALQLKLGEKVVGGLLPARADQLTRWPGLFEQEAEIVHLRLEDASPEERTRRLREICESLAADELIDALREEPYPASPAWGEAPDFLVDRAAVAFFGTAGYGVHLDGWFVREGVPHVWIAKRAQDRGHWPGMRDHLCAGGQPATLSLSENLVKEGAEEASIPADWLHDLRPRTGLRYLMIDASGVRNDTLFCYDLELPLDWTPVNTDGEVERFEATPLPQVIDALEQPGVFKPNVALVLLEFLLAKGWLEGHPEARVVAEALEGLRVPVPQDSSP